jgi:hypothetical protein
VLVDYKPVARYIQDAMLAGKCQLYVDGIPTSTRRREDEGGAAHTGLRRKAVCLIDGMGEAAGAMCSGTHSQALAVVRTVAHDQIHIHRLPGSGTREAVLEPHFTARPACPYGAARGRRDTGADKAHRQQQGHTDPV